MDASKSVGRGASVKIGDAFRSFDHRKSQHVVVGYASMIRSCGEENKGGAKVARTQRRIALERTASSAAFT